MKKFQKHVGSCKLRQVLRNKVALHKNTGILADTFTMRTSSGCNVSDLVKRAMKVVCRNRNRCCLNSRHASISRNAGLPITKSIPPKVSIAKALITNWWFWILIGISIAYFQVAYSPLPTLCTGTLIFGNFDKHFNCCMKVTHTSESLAPESKRVNIFSLFGNKAKTILLRFRFIEDVKSVSSLGIVVIAG